MQEFEGVGHNINQNLAGSVGAFPVFPQSGFCKLYIPVTEYIPDKVVQLADSDTQLEFFEVVGYFLNQLVVFAQNPFILNCQIVWQFQAFRP